MRRMIGVGLCLALTSLPLAVTAEPISGTVWTGIIPDAFPDIEYQWTILADGTYEENGWRKSTGGAVQPTLTGIWSYEADLLFMMQDTDGFSFAGEIHGDFMSGNFFEDGSDAGIFCAFKGEVAPVTCQPAEAVS
ncbi:MAG: hypothetical protein RLN72_13540 [Henriciella sp.]